MPTAHPTGPLAWRRGSRRRPPRAAAFSLVEVLIAGFVLAAVLVPLIGLLTSAKTDQQSEDGMGEAVTLCENVMELLLSDKIPFTAIDPAGGAPYAKGGPEADVPQAGFRDTPGASAVELESLICDGSEELPGGERFRSRYYRGKTYLLSFFAGKYPDHPPIDDPGDPGHKRPDIDHTLTFSFHDPPAPIRMPYGIPHARRDQINQQVVVQDASIAVGDRPETVPYVQRPFSAIGGVAPEAIALPPEKPFSYKQAAQNVAPGKKEHRLLAGWPDPGRANPAVKYDLADPKGSQRAVWTEHLRNVVKRQDGAQPTLAYHPTVLDQRMLRVPGGGLMKLVVGVQFSPYGFSHLRRSDAIREFWLVSFKAQLSGDAP